MDNIKFENCALVLNAINIPIFVHDSDNRIIYANEWFFKIIEKSARDIENVKYWDVLDNPTMPACIWHGSDRNEEDKHILSISGRTFNQNIFTVHEKEGGLGCHIHLLIDVTDFESKKQELQCTNKKLEQVLEESINITLRLIEQHDMYTSKHQIRTSILAKAIAEEMHFSSDGAKGIYFGAIVHDIGKIHIPMEILTAPRKLAAEEFSLIKKHAVTGHKIISQIPFRWPIGEMILQHHERLDGSGYPNGLTGKDIILEARIIAVADVFEAMFSNRPYRPALSKEVIYSTLQKGSGKLYDPDVVEACVKIVKNHYFDSENWRWSQNH